MSPGSILFEMKEMTISRVVTAVVLLWAFDCAKPSIAAQVNIEIGMKAGAQLLPQFTGSQDISNSSRLILGPSLEVTVPKGFAFEFDALIKRMNNHTQLIFSNDRGLLGIQTNTFDTTARAWEFPVVLKKYFDTSPGVRVFPEAGMSFRRISGRTNFQTTFSNCDLPVACQPSSGTVNPSTNSWTGGPVIGAGIDLHKGLVHVRPELRYTLWVGQAFSSPSYGTSNSRALDILVGISLGK